MICIRLFLAFVSIGAFSFGGGYAAMPLIQSQVVERYGWISLADFADLVTIAEMTPGPIAVNAAPLWETRWRASPAPLPPRQAVSFPRASLSPLWHGCICASGIWPC